MTARVNLFGFQIDPLTMSEAVGRLNELLAVEGPCRYVVTPNVDHVVVFQHHAGLRASYADASLVLADGWPVVAASRILRRPVPERVPGSDLVPALFGAAEARGGVSVFLLGAAPSVVERAAERIRARWPAVRVVGTYSPRFGFENDPTENDAILARVALARPELLVVGLGAPKQELWVHAHRDRIAAKVALCAGATIDFLAGEKSRAPRWMQRTGLEWFHRLATEPGRLTKRYLRDAWFFPQLVMREWVKAQA